MDPGSLNQQFPHKEVESTHMEDAIITIRQGTEETRINLNEEAVGVFNRMFDHQKISGEFPERLARLLQDSLKSFMQDPRFAPPHIADMLRRMKELDEQLAKVQEDTAKRALSIAEKSTPLPPEKPTTKKK